MGGGCGEQGVGEVLLMIGSRHSRGRVLHVQRPYQAHASFFGLTSLYNHDQLCKPAFGLEASLCWSFEECHKLDVSHVENIIE